MTEKYTNPNTNFNIDLLKSQYKIFALVYNRKLKVGEKDEELRKELEYLWHIIHLKCGINTNV